MRILLLWLWLSPLSVFAGQVDVYLASDQKVIGLPLSYQGRSVEVTYVDEIYRLEDQLSIDVPSDEDAARQMIRTRLQGREVELATKIVSAWQQTIRAHNAGISYVPAIVIDRRWVVYGELDFAAAMRIFEQRR